MTQMMTKDHTPLAQYQAYAGAGYESFGETELVKPPTLAISQPTSEYNEKGVWYLNGETIGTSVRVVPLHIQRMREYAPGNGYDAPRICWSRDFWQPAANVSERQSPICAKRGPGRPIPVCPMAKWTTDAQGQRQPSPCRDKWVMAVALVDEQLTVDPTRTALYYIQSMALGPARSFVGGLRTKYRQMPMFGIAVDIELLHRTKRDGFAGNFYTPDFPDVKDQSDAERIHFMAMESLPELHELHLFFKDYFEAGQDIHDDATPADIGHEEPKQEHSTHNATPDSRVPSIDNDGWGAA